MASLPQLSKAIDLQAQSIFDLHRRSSLQPVPKGSDIMTIDRLKELVKNVEPNEELDPEVGCVLLQIADEFVDNVATFACAIAKHRKSSTLDSKDVQLYLDHSWNIRIPGFTSGYNHPLRVDSQRSKSAQMRKMAVQNAINNPRKRKAPPQP